MSNFFKKNQDLSFLGLSSIIPSLVLAGFWFILAIFIEPDEYGKIAFVLAIAMLAVRICYLGVGDAVIVNSAKDPKVIPTIYFVTILSGIIASIIVYFVYFDIGISVYVIGFVLFSLTVTKMLGKQQYKKYSYSLIIQSILQLGLTLLLYFLMGIGGVVLGFGISFLFTAYLVIPTLREYKINLAYFKSNLFFIGPSYIATLLKSASGTIDKIILLPILGYAAIGNYHLALQFFGILLVFPSILIKYLLPQRSVGKENKKFEIYAILISITLGVLGFFLAPVVVPMIFPKFLVTIEILPMISLAIIPKVITSLILVRFTAKKQSVPPLLGGSAFTVIHLGMLLILADTIGLFAVGLGFLLGSIFETIILYMIYLKGRKNAYGI